jgi:hypothetical protein
MSSHQKITERHRQRRAVVYVRQSTLVQVERNTESAQRQYALRDRAIDLGWPASAVVVVDEDTGRSGASTDGRLGFKELVAEVGLGHVGLILALEVSRFARSSADWHQLIDLCALTGTLIADSDAIYSPADFNDRLLLGLKGTMSRRSCTSSARVWTAGCAPRPSAASCGCTSRSASIATRTAGPCCPPTSRFASRSSGSSSCGAGSARHARSSAS